MDFQRTLLIGGLAIVGYLMILQWDKDYNQVPTTTQQQEQHQTVPSSEDAPQLTQAKQGTADDIPKLDTVSDAPTDSASVSEQVVTVTTDTLAVEIDTKGGNIVKVSLLKYPVKLPDDEEPNPAPFTLLERSSARTFIAQSGLIGPDGTDSKGKPTYQTAQTSYQLNGGDTLNVDLSLIDKKGVKVIKRYTFTKGTYEVKVSYVVDNTSSTTWQANLYAQLKRDNTQDPSNSASSMGMSTYLGAAVRGKEERYVKLPFDEFDEEKFSADVTGGYAAILQHYFVSSWIPNQEQLNTFYTRKAGNNNIVGFKNQNNPLKLAAGEKGEISATLYIGPKDQKRLAELADGLELTIDYGVLWFVAQPLFWLLTFIHSLIPNWGWSIILLTVLVKAAFYPLSAASYRSMANMRRLSPKLQEMRERFGDDRQKMSQAMMEMYKKEKINPLGGCLPILVQMPVFIALYWVLLESVELRQAPWLGWITDLSVKDPYFILPLIMGASMFVQQLLNPTPPDPMQAKVMKMMPIIFTVFFLFFPAGLVLYWVVNNLLSIAQQWMITRQIEGQAAAKSTK
ncbi:membrane protein insertase YidC [Spartinivicinus poritis]|uniref:Membrane protein insertase YidC n=1 Tax=Spartinivicinus poritis TaxID=2994640 RepID=A0ABT5UBK0_9GAMM|nr:membrane protein insertase YidC [Spartinivicinus sp. A2-2]MDE1463747.1 membrane protein insertase YidC [Spartinivicinus sp. A2-2]